MCSNTWVGLTLIWMFHLLAHLPSRLWQIPISPSRIGQTVEHSKFKSAQPSPRAHETPCTDELHIISRVLPDLGPPRARRLLALLPALPDVVVAEVAAALAALPLRPDLHLDQRSILRSMPVAYSDSPPTLYVVKGRAKPVLHGLNSTEPRAVKELSSKN